MPRGTLNELKPEYPAFGSEGRAEALAAYDAWHPQWRLGFGPLQLAAGVTLVGQEGVVLDDSEDAEVEGAVCARFVLVSFSQGGSVTMKKCSSTGLEIYVESGASLVMVDCRVFGKRGYGDIVIISNFANIATTSIPSASRPGG